MDITLVKNRNFCCDTFAAQILNRDKEGDDFCISPKAFIRLRRIVCSRECYYSIEGKDCELAIKYCPFCGKRVSKTMKYEGDLKYPYI